MTVHISGYGVNSTYQNKKIDNYNEHQSNILSSSNISAGKRDTVEISSNAYKMQKAEKEMSAHSGKDVLGISKGKGENEYIVHFSDSAMVSRAISRGKITVNGIDIELPEETIQKLKEVNAQAEKERVEKFMERHMKHNMAVAEQQAEAIKNALDTPDLLKLLFGIDDDEIKHRETKPDGCTSGAVCEDDFEWITYDTRLSVNIDEGLVSIGEVFKGEILLNEGK